MGLFQELFFTGGRADSAFNSDTRGVDRRASEEVKPVATFITLQTLASFPGAALVVTIVWRFFAAALGWESRAVPLVTAFLVGGLLYLISLGTAKPKTPGEWVTGAFIAIVNSMYLGLSVLGIDIAMDASNIAESVPK